MDVKKVAEKVEKGIKDIREARKCLDCVTERLTGEKTSRKLETIVMSMTKEITETYSLTYVPNDLYEILQAHVYDAYDAGFKSNESSVL